MGWFPHPCGGSFLSEAKDSGFISSNVQGKQGLGSFNTGETSGEKGGNKRERGGIQTLSEKMRVIGVNERALLRFLNGGLNKRGGSNRLRARTPYAGQEEDKRFKYPPEGLKETNGGITPTFVKKPLFLKEPPRRIISHDKDIWCGPYPRSALGEKEPRGNIY